MVRKQSSFAERTDGRGALYLVGTPIGNLEDMTYRAVRTLREADIIAAEDTRQTRKLLSHYEIEGRLVSYHEHNRRASGTELIRLMLEGRTVALVSDAGLPGISDPGADLAALAVEVEIPVIPVPGANAALSALIVSGLATDRFLFYGFLPRDNKRRKEALARLRQAEETILLYESPHRLAATLDELLAELGDRQAALVRELTKKYEEMLRGSLRECRDWLDDHPPKGEYCLVLEGGPGGGAAGAAGEAAWWSGLDPAAHVEAYTSQGRERKEAMKLAARDRGVSKREIYRQLLEE